MLSSFFSYNKNKEGGRNDDDNSSVYSNDSAHYTELQKSPLLNINYYSSKLSPSRLAKKEKNYGVINSIKVFVKNIHFLLNNEKINFYSRGRDLIEFEKVFSSLDYPKSEQKNTVNDKDFNNLIQLYFYFVNLNFHTFDYPELFFALDFFERLNPIILKIIEFILFVYGIKNYDKRKISEYNNLKKKIIDQLQEEYEYQLEEILNSDSNRSVLKKGIKEITDESFLETTNIIASVMFKNNIDVINFFKSLSDSIDLIRRGKNIISENDNETEIEQKLTNYQRNLDGDIKRIINKILSLSSELDATINTDINLNIAFTSKDFSTCFYFFIFFIDFFTSELSGYHFLDYIFNTIPLERVSFEKKQKFLNANRYNYSSLLTPAKRRFKRIIQKISKETQKRFLIPDDYFYDEILTKEDNEIYTSNKKFCDFIKKENFSPVYFNEIETYFKTFEFSEKNKYLSKKIETIEVNYSRDRTAWQETKNNLQRESGQLEENQQEKHTSFLNKRGSERLSEILETRSVNNPVSPDSSRFSSTTFTESPNISNSNINSSGKKSRASFESETSEKKTGNEDKIFTLNLQIEDLRRENGAIEARLSTAKRDLADERSKLAVLSKTKKDLEQEISNLQTRLQSTENSLTQKTNTLNYALANLEREKNSFNSMKVDYENQKRVLETQLFEVRRQLNNQGTNNSQQVKKISDLETKCNKLEGDLRIKTEELNAKISEQAEKISALEETKNSLKNEKRSLEEKKVSLENTVNQHLGTISSNNTDIRNLNGRISSLENDKISLENNKRNLVTEKENLEQTLRAKDEELQTLKKQEKEKYENLEGKNSTKAVEIEKARKDLDVLRTKNTNLETEKNRLAETKQNLSNQINSLSNRINELNSEKNTIQENKERLETQLADENQKNIRLESEKTSLKEEKDTEIKKLKEETANYKATLESEKQQKEQELEILRSELNVVKQELDVFLSNVKKEKDNKLNVPPKKNEIMAEEDKTKANRIINICSDVIPPLFEYIKDSVQEEKYQDLETKVKEFKNTIAQLLSLKSELETKYEKDLFSLLSETDSAQLQRFFPALQKYSLFFSNALLEQIGRIKHMSSFLKTPQPEQSSDILVKEKIEMLEKKLLEEEKKNSNNMESMRSLTEIIENNSKEKETLKEDFLNSERTKKNLEKEISDLKGENKKLSEGKNENENFINEKNSIKISDSLKNFFPHFLVQNQFSEKFFSKLENWETINVVGETKMIFVLFFSFVGVFNFIKYVFYFFGGKSDKEKNKLTIPIKKNKKK